MKRGSFLGSVTQGGRRSTTASSQVGVVLNQAGVGSKARTERGYAV